MSDLQELKKAIIGAVLGRHASISGRVFRAATGQWEESSVLTSGYRGGIVEPLRIIWGIITGKKPKITINKLPK